MSTVPPDMSIIVNGSNNTSVLTIPYGQQLAITCQGAKAVPAVELMWIINDNESTPPETVFTTGKFGNTFTSISTTTITPTDVEGRLQCRSSAGKTFSGREVEIQYRTFREYFQSMWYEHEQRFEFLTSYIVNSRFRNLMKSFLFYKS